MSLILHGGAFGDGLFAADHPHEAASSVSDVRQPMQLGQPAFVLGYHKGALADEQFIPKIVGGFISGAVCTGVCIALAVTLLVSRSTAAHHDVMFAFAGRALFTLGIAGVAASLLLVALKYRDDHAARPLIARHWTVALLTGAVFAVLIWGPWCVAELRLGINRFVMGGIWFALMSYPAFACFWLVTRTRE